MRELKHEDKTGNLVENTGDNNENPIKHCRQRSSRYRGARNISEGQTTEKIFKKIG